MVDYVFTSEMIIMGHQVINDCFYELRSRVPFLI